MTTYWDSMTKQGLSPKQDPASSAPTSSTVLPPLENQRRQEILEVRETLKKAIKLAETEGKIHNLSSLSKALMDTYKLEDELYNAADPNAGLDAGKLNTPVLQEIRDLIEGV